MAQKTGLVMEGGAMRGMFTAGVTDVLMENGVEFPAAVGVSAGAVFGCNVKSRQKGRVIRYTGPVDSSEYQQDYSPALTIEEFAKQVPQGVFAANACLELQWMGVN